MLFPLSHMESNKFLESATCLLLCDGISHPIAWRDTSYQNTLLYQGATLGWLVLLPQWSRLRCYLGCLACYHVLSFASNRQGEWWLLVTDQAGFLQILGRLWSSQQPHKTQQNGINMHYIYVGIGRESNNLP
jgi:hypothetical protein